MFKNSPYISYRIFNFTKDEGEISKELRGKYLGIALGKAERLEDLINEFFEITRFNLPDLSLEKSKVNLKLMLEQIIFEFHPTLRAENLEIHLNLEEDVFVRLDINKIQRVFDNLLRKAINYSFEDSIIDIIVEMDKSLIIEIINSGGSGLGLSIAKEIVKLHNGELTATSFDEMKEFKMEIPL